jgi:hypothetical protein
MTYRSKPKRSKSGAVRAVLREPRRSTSLMHYTFSRRQIVRHKCKGCGLDVIRIGDYCMLRTKIWEGQLGLGWTDNMCVACIEARLGRQLRFRDFICFPSVEGFAVSDTLRSRLGLKVQRRVDRSRRRKAMYTR